MNLKNIVKIESGYEEDLELSHFAVPKPEDIELDKWYSFTLSPKDEFAPSDISGNFVSYSKDWQRRIENIHSADIKMYVEYSQAGRLHFHGLIMIKRPVLFYMKDLKILRSYGDTHIKGFKVNDGPQNWDLYCRKLQLRDDGRYIADLVDVGLKLFYDNRSKFFLNK